MRAASILAALLGGGTLGHWGSDPLLSVATGSGNQRGQQRRAALGGKLVWDCRRGTYANPLRATPGARLADIRAKRYQRKVQQRALREAPNA